MTEALKGKEGLNEQERLKNNTARGLSNLRKDVIKTNKEKTKEQKDVEAVHACINHLRLVVDEKYYKNVMEKNTEVTIKSVQFLLKSKGYDVGKVDGMLMTKGGNASKTVEAIKRFQRDNGLKVDGTLGKETIKRLLKIYETYDTINKARAEYGLKANGLTILTDGEAQSVMSYNSYLDLNRVTKITDKQAEILSYVKHLELNGLTNLTSKQIELLSGSEDYHLKTLYINGLKSITNQEIKYLSKLDYISLDGLTRITDEQAHLLSQLGEGVSLCGLKSITEKQAQYLGTLKCLHLNGLTKLTNNQAISLSRVESLSLEGLTSITDEQAEYLFRAKNIQIDYDILTEKQRDLYWKYQHINHER